MFLKLVDSLFRHYQDQETMTKRIECTDSPTRQLIVVRETQPHHTRLALDFDVTWDSELFYLISFLAFYVIHPQPNTFDGKTAAVNRLVMFFFAAL